MVAGKVTKVSRPFRIIALPLVRIPHGPLRALGANGGTTPAAGAASVNGSADIADGNSNGSGNSNGNGDNEVPLTLYHVQQPDVDSKSGPPPIVNRALEKASDAWLKLGDKKPGTVMRWFYDKGEKLMDRMDFEEWALKNVHEGKGVKIADPKKGEVQEKIEIPLLRPENVSPQVALIPKLHRQLLHRIPHHKKMMYRWFLGSPITWPFAIIPIIPNFPMFYFLWRAWSHYKAWRGALYLEQLLKAGMIVEKPSEKLTEIYTRRQIAHKAEDPHPDSSSNSKSESDSSSSSSSSSSEDPSVLASDQEPASPSPKPEAEPYGALLISKDDLPALEAAFDLRHQEMIDIERAIEQADHRASDAAKVLRLKAEGAGAAEKK